MPKDSELMTIGELAARTGLTIKAISELEGRGLIFSAGRSESNYRLFDSSALWCCEVIGNLRSVGLTLKEIEELWEGHLQRPDEPVGPRLAALLERAEQRIDERVQELEEVRDRIRAFRAQRPDVLAGEAEHELTGEDPRGGAHGSAAMRAATPSPGRHATDWPTPSCAG